MIYTTPAGSIPGLYADILHQPHAIIAGATGSGKSVAINGLIYAGLYKAPPEVGFVLIDPKRVELIQYAHLPQVIRYASEPGAMLSTLCNAVDLMERRYSDMQRRRCRRWTGQEIYIFVDEYADLITTQKRAVKPLFCRLAQLGRAAGIHLVLATQRPTRDIIDGQIKVNIDARLALRCPTAQDSRNIINIPGAEELPRYGEGLYITPDTMHPVLVNVPMIPDAELDRLVTHWEQQTPRRRWA